MLCQSQYRHYLNIASLSVFEFLTTPKSGSIGGFIFTSALFHLLFPPLPLASPHCACFALLTFIHSTLWTLRYSLVPHDLSLSYIPTFEPLERIF